LIVWVQTCDHCETHRRRAGGIFEGPDYGATACPLALTVVWLVYRQRWGPDALPSVYVGRMQAPFRVGSGHDIHRLVEGRALVLGGVEVPSGVGFDTHSDGDVLSHALIDALAGAIADGDLGTHFPEDDPEADDARSLEFVGQFAQHVRASGYEIANVDCFVVLGTTKLRPHLDRMRRNLVEALDVDVKQVSVKARSNDGFGDEGQGRACAAWATVLVYPASD
jgi:2-C-methyl-D-erythritol 2,4-cyclodiphosphate synthase